MKKFVVSMFAFTLFGSFASAVATSVEVARVSQVVETVEAARAAIARAANNLIPMKSFLSDSESDSVTKVINESWLLFATAGEIVTVGDIYCKMKTREDQKTAMHYFRGSVRKYGRQVEISLPFINSILPSIKTPAALAEATKVRDKMLEALEASHRFETDP